MCLLTCILLKQTLSSSSSFLKYLHRGLFGSTSSSESLISLRQKQRTTPALVQFLADNWCAALMSCLLFPKSSNSESLQEKQKRNLSQPGLNYSNAFVFCRISTFHWQSCIYTLTFSDDTAAPRNILEKAIHNIIFHSLPTEFSTLDSSQIHYQCIFKDSYRQPVVFTWGFQELSPVSMAEPWPSLTHGTHQQKTRVAKSERGWFTLKHVYYHAKYLFCWVIHARSNSVLI